jgi:outer membrane protein
MVHSSNYQLLKKKKLIPLFLFYMKRCFSTLIITLLACTAFGQELWDLRKCIDYAMANSISVKQAEAQARSSLLSYQQSKMTRLPTLGGGVNASYRHGLNENPTTGTLESSDFISGNIGVQSNYSIFNWGARKAIIASDQLFSKADAVAVDKAKNDIALLVANAFLQVMLRREQVRISEVQLGQSRAQLVNTRKLVSAGSQPELNAIQIEAQMARDTALLLEAQSLQVQALITLKSYLNIDLATPFDIAAPAVENIPVDNIADLQPEVVYAIAEKTQPTQQMTALRVQASEEGVKAARANMYPTLNAFGSLSTAYVSRGKTAVLIGIDPKSPTGAYVLNSAGRIDTVFSARPLYDVQNTSLPKQLKNNFGQAIGVSLNFNIFNQYQSRTQWERAKINVRQAQLQDEQEKLNLKANIYNAYQEAFAAFQKYNAALRSVDASERAFNMSQKRYDIGLLGTLDYITTQSNLFRARIEAISNRYDYVFRMKVLEFYKGQGLRL